MAKPNGLKAKDDTASNETSANSSLAIFNALKGRPTIGLLAVGLLVILAGAVETIELGWLNLTSRGSQNLLLLVGGVLCVPALVAPARGAIHRQRVLVTPYQLPPEANDVDFVFTMFYTAMPPAFVKRVERDKTGEGFRSYDIFYSREFDEIQQAMVAADESRDPLAAIRQDHHNGDAVALAQRHSRQLELPPVMGRRTLPILTVKTHFQHKGKDYIAGWYLPVDLTELEVKQGTEGVWLRDAYDQPLLRPLLETDDQRGIQVQVGAALRSAGRD